MGQTGRQPRVCMTLSQADYECVACSNVTNDNLTILSETNNINEYTYFCKKKKNVLWSQRSLAVLAQHCIVKDGLYKNHCHRSGCNPRFCHCKYIHKTTEQCQRKRTVSLFIIVQRKNVHKG